MKSYRIGEKINGDDNPSVFELKIDDFVSLKHPASYSLPHDTPHINPVDYFITSGDAVEKAIVLEKDMWELAGNVRTISYEQLQKEKKCSEKKARQLHRNGKRPKKKGYANYETDVWRAAGQCRKLLNALKKAKGENCFLETEWDDHKLLCIQKNPRK